MGYALDHIEHTDVFEGISPYTLAKKVFGIARVEEAVQQVVTSINDLGHTQYWQTRSAATTIGYVLLMNKSPRLTDITLEILETARQRKRESYLRRNLVALSQALTHMGILTRPLDHLKTGFSLQREIDIARLPTTYGPLRSVAGEQHFLLDLTLSSSNICPDAVWSPTL